MAEVMTLVAAWLITYLLHSTLLLGGAWLGERCNLVRSSAGREFVWRVALVGGVLTATLQFGTVALDLPRPGFLPGGGMVVLRALDVEALDDGEATSASAAGDGSEIRSSAPPVIAAGAPAVAPSSTISGASSATPRGARFGAAGIAWWPGAVCILWALAAAAAAIRLGRSVRRTRRELAGRQLDDGSELHRRLRTLCTADARPMPRLTRSTGLSGPVSLPNNEICLPAWVPSALTPVQQQALLAHELAHLRRRDPQWMLCTRLLQVLLIGQPLNGLALRRLTALSELEADAWAARAVGDPRSLAECLAACAERLLPRRAQSFGTAMTDRSSLVERVQRLLQGLHLHPEKVPNSVRAGALLALLAIVALVPVIVVRAGGRHTHSSSVSIDKDLNGHRLSAKVTRPDYSLKGTLDGEVGFNDRESEVTTMSAGAVFELEEAQSGVTRRIRLESKDGAVITHRYWLEGREEPFEAEARAWLSTALSVWRRATTKPENRVAGLLACGGVAAVLDEIATFDDDYNRAQYLAALYSAQSLTPAEFVQTLSCAERIASDYERRSTFQAGLVRVTDPACQTALLQAAKSLGSDHEMAEFLTGAAARLGPAPAPWDAWLTTARGIESDFELRRTITALLKNGFAPSDAVARVLEEAGGSFDSDFDLCELLAATVPRLGADPTLLSAYIAATRDVGSDFERGRALRGLMEGVRLDAAGCGQVLDVIADMGGEFERSQAMIALAKGMPADAALIHKYHRMTRTLPDHERGRAERAIDHLSL